MALKFKTLPLKLIKLTQLEKLTKPNNLKLKKKLIKKIKIKIIKQNFLENIKKKLLI